ncbi:MAG: TRC40/GET3/ArsA family transport-energizing ATPase [Myxococcota bacterium]
MRVLLFAGKGGVGKTSLALATALAAAEHGHRCCVISTDAAHSLSDALARPVGPQPVEVAPKVVAQEVSTLAELDRSWEAIETWLRALLFQEDHLVAEELLVWPGLEEWVSLRAIHEAASTGAHDLCIVDCAPTAANLRLLRLPDVLRVLMGGLWDWKRRAARAMRPVAERLGAGNFVAPEHVFDAFEALTEQVEAVRQLLTDPERSQARLVVNPARVVVEETRRTFAYLSLYGVACDAVLVNRGLPAELSTPAFARQREREREQCAQIEAGFPLPIFEAPLRAEEPIGASALRELGLALYGTRDPASRFVDRPPVRFRSEADVHHLEIALGAVPDEEWDVWLRGEDLVVSVRDFERRIALPASMADLAIHATEWRDGVLDVSLGAAEA